MSVVAVPFEGPFSWPGLPGAPSIFESTVGQSSGVYLWTVPQDERELIYYVGETGRSFAERLQEHYREHAAGFYHLNDADALTEGRRELVWPGLWHAGERPTPASCIRRFLKLAPLIDALTHTYRFYVAPIDCPTRVRKRIEAAIARVLAGMPPPVGTFQEEGIRYHGRKAGEEPVTCRLVNCDNLRGVPCELVV
jgi:hypothetical protein